MDTHYKDKLFKGATPIIFENARELRKELTPSKDLLWQELRNRKLNGLKFRRQHPINQYIADFYCSEKQLVIEVDGNIHNTKEAREYDAARTADLASMGIRLLRFTNEEVEKDMATVLNRITHFANKEQTKK